MEKYELKFDKKFLEKYRKRVDINSQRAIDKKILQLKENPTKGKPLFDVYPHLYELYADSFRLYYLVQHHEIRIVVLAYEHKNNQQKILNQIRNDKSFIDNILKEIV